VDDFVIYSYVVGGCTGVFEGVGWNKKAPFAEEEEIPSIHLAVVGKYDGE